MTQFSAILLSLYKLLNDDGKILIVDLNIDDGSFHAESPDFDGHNIYTTLDLSRKNLWRSLKNKCLIRYLF